jgi:pimeloyl-ACP methyl ester carboxylesterase
MERIEFEGAGVTIVADAVGPVDAPPVLFMHGGGQTRQSWGKAIIQAARNGYRAISVDLRGHGESGWSPDGQYGMEAFAGDIRKIIPTLSQPPVLVGASLGGLVGMTIAGSPPPEVRGLVLVDVAVQLEEEGTREIGNFMGSAPNGFANLEEAADAVAAYLPHRTRPKDTSGLMRNLRLRADGRLHWHWDPAFTKLDPETARNFSSAFEDAAKAIKVPVLLIRGGRSRVLSPEGAQAFLRLVPGTEYVDVAGADHMVAGDANDSFNEAVLGFLAKHMPVTAPPR